MALDHSFHSIITNLHPMYSIKSLSLSVLSFILAVALSACGGDATNGSETADPDASSSEASAEQHGHMPNPKGAKGAGAVRAEMRDGMQVIEMEARTTGYQPEQIQLEAGVPAQLVITRTTQSACMKQINIPQYGIEERTLPMNESVTVEFTPEETGTFTFVCGMDMQRGTMMVKS